MVRIATTGGLETWPANGATTNANACGRSGVEVERFDLEAMLMVRPTAMLDLFVGYRMIEFQGSGEVDNDTFQGDFQLGGFMVGGGIRF